MNSPNSSSKNAQVKAGSQAKFEGKSLAAAILAHVLLLIGAFFISFNYFQSVQNPANFQSTVQSGGSADTKFQIQGKRQPISAPISHFKGIFAEGLPAQFAIQEVGRNPSPIAKLETLPCSSLSSGLGGLGGSGGGLGNGFGNSLGNSLANGLGNGIENHLRFEQIPVQMRQRCSKTERLQRLKEMGGIPACEDAVVKALKWLKANQNPDGSWGDDSKIKMTGLALLAYFGHCETQTSEEFGESIIRGVIYLINIGIKNQGRLINPHEKIIDCYEHAIGTYALGEAVTLCKDLDLVVPFATEITGQAANYIMTMQNSRGSWDNNYDKSTDQANTPVSGWQMQALAACRNVHIQPDLLVNIIDKALHSMNLCQDEKGRFGENSEWCSECEYGSLTGVGMLCNQIWGREESQEVKRAANYIYLNSNFDYNGPKPNLECHYYESQAMIQMGGRYWNKYNQMFRDTVLSNQNSNGSWNTPLSQKESKAINHCNSAEKMSAKVYRTTLCILMLEVYYRDLTTSEASGAPQIHRKP